MPISKAEFIAAFGVAKNATATAGKCALRRRDYGAMISMEITVESETVVLEWSANGVSWGGRSSDSPVPLMELLATSATKAALRRMLEKFLGATKLASLENPQGAVRLGGFSSILVTHESSSLSTPTGFAADIDIAAAMLLDTKNGSEIAARALHAGVSLRVSYAAGKFEFAPSLSSSSTLSTSSAGVLLADSRVSTRYFSLRRSGDGEASVGGWFHGAISAVLAHELIHAIHCYTDLTAYLERGGKAGSHEDWENMEEQFTITGVLEGKEIDVSECGVLRELNLRMRWGHVPMPTLRGAVSTDVLQAVYGSEWATRF